MTVPVKTPEPDVDFDLALKHGLTREEYDRVVSILGRTPTYTELGIFSVMWSEHCSYKNSIAVLKTLPREGSRLLVGAGEENAGLVDVGGGFAVAFKIESHNHPSAVEPYQGAATGVGGIMRDIFTMGARPIAALNSLRFGSLDNERTKFLLRGVVKGIGDYGNSFGVPTVAGEVCFEPCYQENPLVNAMAVGIVKHGRWASAIAKGAGNPVMIVGSSTGRDGIHGATFASEEISEESEAKRPSVQVGDPFTEKLLLEATLEAIRSGFLVGIQDMGAAGLTCSSTEMSAKGKSGMRINLDRVPARETGMSAYELMLSESQERMLVVVKKGHEEEVREIFAKWDLHAEIIGVVTDEPRVVVEYEGSVVADVPAEPLVLGGGAPVYIREAIRPEYLNEVEAFDPAGVPEAGDLNSVLLRLLGTPNIASKRWVYEQYDHMVRTNNLVLAEGDAGVILIKGTNKALAMKTDCNGRYVYLSPHTGGMSAVAEAARNVVCTGALPIAVTNCLNFGNPYDPEIYWQFREAVRGMGDACRALDTPVTGGNVSFYNGSPTATVYPTPVIGMLGLVEDLAHVTTVPFRHEGDAVVLLGPPGSGHIGGSEYLATIHEIVSGTAPPIDINREKAVQGACLDAIRDGIVQSAHDVSDGGLAVAVAECCFVGPDSSFGVTADLPDESLRPDRALFGEDQSRIIVSVAPSGVEQLRKICETRDVSFKVLGKVTRDDRIRIGGRIDVGVEEAKQAYYSGLEEYLSE
ncbi:MAG: phosphoribosylformylglycinamidine synthase subunit PurL [Ignavibacteria bacterium]|nr:phosphoribosylformylglycinamidine synthase subunit PurL [Ignavibacteria bacterium]